MKRFLGSISIFAISLVFMWQSNIMAQSKVLKSWGFESSVENWVTGTDNSTVSLSTDHAVSGSQSVKLVKPATGNQLNFQNDVYKNVKSGDSIQVNIWMSSADTSLVNGIQIFWQNGSGWSWNSIWVNGTDLTGDGWKKLVYAFPETIDVTPLQRIGIQVLLKDGNDATTPTVYFDDIEIREPVDPTLVANWGFLNIGARRGGWDLAAGDPGSATISGSAGLTGWSSIRGSFGDTLTTTTTDAVVITGKMEFTGSGPQGWSSLRYGMFMHDSAGTLNNSGTDSAAWSGVESQAHGYMFTPKSGTNDNVGWSSGSGEVGTRRDGNWISTFGDAFALKNILPKPARAEIVAGKYNFAMSVKLQNDGTQELRFYMVSDIDSKYWCGATITVIDTLTPTNSFNGVCFAVNGNDASADMRSFSVTEVHASLGDPIVVPEAPWEDYYIDTWGFLNPGARRGGWDLTPDEVIGNVSIGGDAALTGWSAIRGGFVEPMEVSTDQAVIITGKMEFTGGGPLGWSSLRYGIFNHDSAGVVQVDSVADSNLVWTGVEAQAHGYMFSPRSGTNDPVGWGSGSGEVGARRSGNWISTYGDGFGLKTVLPKPARAQIVAGKYDFAISVKGNLDGTQEVRFYMVSEGSSKYWFGGSVIVPDTMTTSVFNGVCFAVNGNDASSDMRGLNLTDIKLGLGDQITVPTAPWEDYYIDTWGFLNPGSRRGGWDLTPDEVIGNVSIGGDAALTGWSSIRGGFVEPLEVNTDRAVIVTGKMEFLNGGPQGWSSLRYGIFMHDSAGVVQVDSVADSNLVWTGVEAQAHGYMFSPRSGTNEKVGWGNGSGEVGARRSGNWISTYGDGFGLKDILPKPARAEIKAGKYNFAMSVIGKSDGTQEVRFYMIEAENSDYWFGGSVIVPDTLATSMFNGVCFAVNGNDASADMRGLNLSDIKVGLGEQITVPVAPWDYYYIDAKKFAFFGGKTGGWDFTQDEVNGNASISGSSALTGWAAVRGEFDEPFEPTVEQPLTITGKVKFVGGGFEPANSFRFGIFNTNSAGTVAPDSTLDSNLVWTGSDAYCNGYLFVPTSGKNSAPKWIGSTTSGTWGAVVNSTWLAYSGADNYVISDQLQYPENAVAEAGEYEFGISIRPQKDGANFVKYSLKRGTDYYFEGYATDNHNPLATNAYNSICFAVNNTALTEFNILDVQIDTTGIITDVDGSDGENQLPTEFSLGQNYPNPFNPTTTIKFALPKESKVKIAVYDILGRLVTNLVNGEFEAGYHKVTFNASYLSSGVYLYRIEAGDFVNVKKLVLLK